MSHVCQAYLVIIPFKSQRFEVPEGSPKVFNIYPSSPQTYYVELSIRVHMVQPDDAHLHCHTTEPRMVQYSHSSSTQEADGSCYASCTA
jgi:hypothetical protein